MPATKLASSREVGGGKKKGNVEGRYQRNLTATVGLFDPARIGDRQVGGAVLYQVVSTYKNHPHRLGGKKKKNPV